MIHRESKYTNYIFNNKKKKRINKINICLKFVNFNCQLQSINKEWTLTRQ